MRTPQRVEWPIPDDVSELIDVRAPEEFADDHIPGAVNLPVFTDAERAEVGTIFKQKSPFLARKRGAKIACKNISLHLENHFESKPADYAPMLYCWRGGQRSASMATILGAVGWRTRVLEGGYKSYRHEVLAGLDSRCSHLNLRVLNGLTGSGKTRLLWKLKERGAQVLDLEGLASHKGSLLGLEPGDVQPSQKYFETLLWEAISGFDLEGPVFTEAESRKVGNVHIPNPLWERLTEGPVTEVRTPMGARVAYLLEDYPHWPEEPEKLIARLEVLRERHGYDKIDGWKALIQAGKWAELVQALLTDHYDPSYSKSKNYPVAKDAVELSEVGGDPLERAADRLMG